jgi:hypothetical protein
LYLLYLKDFHLFLNLKIYYERSGVKNILACSRKVPEIFRTLGTQEENMLRQRGRDYANK